MCLVYRVFACFIALVLPLVAQARCGGVDLRQSLSPSARAALQAELATIPFANGLFWHAHKNGRDIYIVGTQHSGDPRMRQIMRQIGPTLRKADLVLLEVTTAQIRAGLPPEQEKALVTLPPNTSLAKLLGPKDWATLSQQLAHRQISAQAVQTLQPWAASDLLASHRNCAQRSWRAWGRQRGLDDRIERHAMRRSIPVAGLEKTEAGLVALNSLPLRDQIQLLRMELHSQTTEANLTTTLSAAYFEGQFSEGRIVSNWAIYRDLDTPRSEVSRLLSAQNERLLDQRTQAWIGQIQHYDVPHLFIAVGAAHLPGRNGLLTLLQQGGWSVSEMPK